MSPPQNALNPQPQEKPDPNMLQQIASNPLDSVWVGASAGTGKTKVLTDRVLRLLLPRSDEAPGTLPHRILCLTYTRAAANEMALRINETLGKWAVLEVGKLKEKLAALFGHEPTLAQINAAQRLFAEVIESAGGLQIMTIHSFCQSVLGRFPLEADLAPNFTLLDDAQSAELLEQALAQVLERAQDEKASPLSAALHNIAAEVDEKTFFDLVRDMARERGQMKALFRQQGPDHIYARICTHYGIQQHAALDDVRRALCEDLAFDKAGLQQTAEAMLQEGGKTSSENGQSILAWVQAECEQRYDILAAHYKTFLTAEGEPRTGHFPVKGVVQSFPQSIDILRAESQRLLEAQDQLNRMKSAALTRNLLQLGVEILKAYDALKAQKGALDFDDLILRTMELLRGETRQLEGYENVTPWIMFKLDQGLDHILIDEAQDTNPDQWKIIEALCEEFFSGLSARDNVARTSFTVGDVKQSIYSFQRAAPEEFQRMQRVFDGKITEVGQRNQNVDLEISFRSTQSVLRAVDGVFQDEMLNKAVGGGDIRHISYRAGQAGLVELWPLFETPKKDKIDFWTPPTALKGQVSGSAQLAAHTAAKISSWIGSKEMLPSAGRPIQPGDIMILVRTRSAFVDQLVRSLKQERIPVSGVDRMMLGEQLAVQDVLSLARFALLPEDDLNLACVLKSPFLGWDEEELFSLAYNRSKSLWQELQHFEAQKLAELEPKLPVVVEEKRCKAYEYLAELIELSKASGSYAFFSRLLQGPCPGDSVSGLRAVIGRLGADALDPLDELLNKTLHFARDHIDTLQTFLAHQEENDIEIKRELEEGGGMVRIMTIHGSKGLQAPIVIMPDTTISTSGRKMSRLLWPDKTKLDFALWSPRGEDDAKAYKRLFESVRSRLDEEYYRLLYVAMTRAADRLYVAGYKPSRGMDEKSWYFMIRKALEADPAIQKLEGDVLRLENPQVAEPDQTKKGKVKQENIQTPPSWVFTSAPEEPLPPFPLVPSRASAEDEVRAALSPLAAGRNHRFRRGNLTHKLLQFLPELEAARREEAALYFLSKNAQDLPQETQNSIVAEVMAILNNPDYAPYFSADSMAEVPVTGLMADNRIISGQIDRLVVGEKDIWILDYKTNRPPPTDLKDIPQTYRNQLKAYRDTLAQIYNQHKIHTALLWTDGPRLMIVE